MSTKIKHIAVIRLSAMGDVAMTVPVLRAFAERYPDVKITMVSRRFFKPFFEDIPNLDFFAADVDGRHKGLIGLFRLYKDLKKLQIDAFADLHNVLRSKIVSVLFSLSGIKTGTVDKARAEKKALTRPENKIFKPLKPITERHAEVFKALGFPIDLTKLTFPAPKSVDADVVALTGTKGNEKWIGIAPYAQYTSKVYPEDLMKDIIDTLAKDPKNRLFLFGGKSEIEALHRLAGGHQNATVLAGKLTLEKEMQLISNLDVMLSMDSGNGHIAAMLGVKVVTLWGATHPFLGFVPFNQPIENSIAADRKKFPLVPTSVYGNKVVPGYDDAMRSISPHDVVELVYRNLL